jgi:hypothetical protein
LRYSSELQKKKTRQFFNLILSKTHFILSSVFVILACDFLLSLNFKLPRMTDFLFNGSKEHYLYFLENYKRHLEGVNVHVVGGILVLLIGGFQFNTKFRVRYPQAHRKLGYLYLGIGTFMGVVGLYISQFSIGGIYTQSAFYLLFILWTTSLALGIRNIRFEKSIERHRIWMTRNYCLSLTNVFMRIYIVLLKAVFVVLPPDIYFPIAAWMALLSGPVISELVLHGYRLRIRSRT